MQGKRRRGEAKHRQPKLFDQPRSQRDAPEFALRGCLTCDLWKGLSCEEATGLAGVG